MNCCEKIIELKAENMTLIKLHIILCFLYKLFFFFSISRQCRILQRILRSRFVHYHRFWSVNVLSKPLRTNFYFSTQSTTKIVEPTFFNFYYSVICFAFCLQNNKRYQFILFRWVRLFQYKRSFFSSSLWIEFILFRSVFETYTRRNNQHENLLKNRLLFFQHVSRFIHASNVHTFVLVSRVQREFYF